MKRGLPCFAYRVGSPHSCSVPMLVTRSRCTCCMQSSSFLPIYICVYTFTYIYTFTVLSCIHHLMCAHRTCHGCCRSLSVSESLCTQYGLSCCVTLIWSSRSRASANLLIELLTTMSNTRVSWLRLAGLFKYAFDRPYLPEKSSLQRGGEWEPCSDEPTTSSCDGSRMCQDPGLLRAACCNHAAWIEYSWKYILFCVMMCRTLAQTILRFTVIHTMCVGGIASF